MLTLTSRHALRALVGLGDTYGKDHVLGRDLAERSRVPSNYLSKILLSLRNAGIVEATRGTGGGYRLHRRPQEIRLVEVAELFEGLQLAPECLLDNKLSCSDEDPCSAHHAWKKVRGAYLQFLETTTLADIIPQGSRPITGEGGQTSISDSLERS